GLESVQRGAEGLGAELTLDRRDVADLDRRRGDPDVAGGVRAVGAAGRRPATRAARLAGRSRGCAAAGQAAGRPRRPLVAARARLVPAALVAGRHPGVLARALRGLDEGAVGQARATRLEDQGEDGDQEKKAQSAQSRALRTSTTPNYPTAGDPFHGAHHARYSPSHPSNPGCGPSSLLPGGG